jgi:hypothetical protein
MAVIGRGALPPGTPTRASMTLNAVILEAWVEGLQLGALVILMLIVICNLRRHVLLHKLILLEVREAGVMKCINDTELTLPQQFLATFQGVVMFYRDPIFGWQVSSYWSLRKVTHGDYRYCSSTIFLLYISYFLHNYISWMKIRPFLERKSSVIYLGSLLLVQPYWAVALWSNFELFNGLGDNHYRQLRPLETFARYV